MTDWHFDEPRLETSCDDLLRTALLHPTFLVRDSTADNAESPAFCRAFGVMGPPGFEPGTHEL
jgi:hypothetical protein